uniref:Uncharacterized protein n=1 Tax=Rhizophagus irregularis (strain DAOM 181602 / DAOM 197198 / MUCL 43194) TaxID=747089 RepID=U9UB89_RHIID
MYRSTVDHSPGNIIAVILILFNFTPIVSVLGTVILYDCSISFEMSINVESTSDVMGSRRWNVVGAKTRSAVARFRMMERVIFYKFKLRKSNRLFYDKKNVNNVNSLHLSLVTGTLHIGKISSI